LTDGVVCINKRAAYITNKTLTSRYECVFYTWVFYLNVPRRLANCKADISLCIKNSPIVIFPAKLMFCTKRSHNRSKTISVDVNYVLKLVLQVWNHFVLTSNGVYQTSTISKNYECGKPIMCTVNTTATSSM
jgi:hypothetical protein